MLVITGGVLPACVATCSLAAILTITSRLKESALKEPLVFSDLALAASFLRYPRFYIGAITLPARIALLGFIAAAMFLLFRMTTSLSARLTGGAIALGGIALFTMLWCRFWSRTMMRTPDLAQDIRSYGLFATLVGYTLRWRNEKDPTHLPPTLSPENGNGFDLLCVIQCESFMDPQDIPGVSPELPNFTRLMRTARQSGHLKINHFGAYTMRSEYGVLFGRCEEQLGFRRYDPYLTARSECSFSLANRLRNLFARRIFLHPHNLHFYGRDRLMPLAGFGELIGPETFDNTTLCGRYVGDAALANKIIQLTNRDKTGGTFLYAVTIENHGPWPGGGKEGVSPLENYKRHLESADRMLSTLDNAFQTSRKRTLLVFFGDHQPSLPGVIAPAHSTRTPYFIQEYSARSPITQQHKDLTPAQLHQSIFDALTHSSNNNANFSQR